MGFASTMDQSFQEGLKMGVAHLTQATSAMKQFDPNKTFDQYSEHPKEADLYKDDKTLLQEEAAKALPDHETAKSIQESYAERPTFMIDPNAPEMQKSKLIQNNAADIVNGISNEFVDCNKQQTCTTTYETKVCEESPKLAHHYCKKTLNIDMNPHQTDTHYFLNVSLSAKKHDYAGVVVHAVTGNVMFKGPSEASLTFSGRLPQGVDCQSLHGTYKITGTQHHTAIDTINLPSCSNGLTVNLHIKSNDDKANLSVQIDMMSSKVEFDPIDHWDDACMSLANNALCNFQSERCLEANTTHVIRGMPVLRACWESESDYLCHGRETDHACQSLREQGCEQIGSICKTRNDGGCTLYSQTYRCPIKKCTDTSVICNGETYCLTEDCLTHTKSSDPDFQKAASMLSAMQDASKTFDEHSIFAGSAKSCSSDIVNFANCCADDGWGIDTKLTECTAEEKELGLAKKNKQTVYVGSYCKTDVLGVCLNHRKAYCVFPSLLGRIVQQQGRGGQLKIPFGSPEQPMCRGITPEELQQIHFDNLDFSDFYEEVSKKEKIYDPAIIAQRIKDNVQGAKP
jgi:conjugal transfer mating pair stabilization protein TraN